MITLSPHTVRLARRLRRAGLLQRTIGKIVGVKQPQVSKTVHRVCWRDVR